MFTWTLQRYIRVKYVNNRGLDIFYQAMINWSCIFGGIVIYLTSIFLMVIYKQGESLYLYYRRFRFILKITEGKAIYSGDVALMEASERQQFLLIGQSVYFECAVSTGIHAHNSLSTGFPGTQQSCCGVISGALLATFLEPLFDIFFDWISYLHTIQTKPIQLYFCMVPLLLGMVLVSFLENGWEDVRGLLLKSGPDIFLIVSHTNWRTGTIELLTSCLQSSWPF